jgi:hypothetical protein
MSITIVRTSASRPEILKISTESMLKNLKYSDSLIWYLHEDILNTQASDACVEYSKSTGLYKDIMVDNRIGHRKSFLKLYDKVETKYLIHWEDDYELLVEIDLDKLIDLMDNYPINQIVFHKRDILPDKPGFTKKTIEFDDIKLTTSPHWMMLPSIQRFDYVKPAIDHIKKYLLEDFHWEINRFLKRPDMNRDADWVLNNSRTFYLGEMRKGKCVEHLGKISKSVRNKTYKW